MTQMVLELLLHHTPPSCIASNILTVAEILCLHTNIVKTAEHLFCERLQKCTLVLYQVIGIIPTGKGRQVIGASLWWYSTPSDFIAKLHYKDCYRGWLQHGNIFLCNPLLGWDLRYSNQVDNTYFQGGRQHANSLAVNNHMVVSWPTRLAWYDSQFFSAVNFKCCQGWLDHGGYLQRCLEVPEVSNWSYYLKFKERGNYKQSNKYFWGR